MNATVTIDTEKQILQDKINDKLRSAELNVKPVLDKIEYENNNSHDFMAPLGNLNVMKFNSNGSLKLETVTSEGLQSFNLHEHAIGQAGEKLGIPTGYIKKLSRGSQWERDLASNILNEHSAYTDRKKVLVRAVGNEVRGILSDQYRRLDTSKIYSAFFNECNKYGATAISANIDATRTYCETILPNVISIPTVKNGVVHMVFGLRISNSDFGDGALRLQSYSMQVVCLNGMTRDNMLRQVHLGRQLPDDLSLSENTYRLDTETQASLISDIVGNSFNPKNIAKQAKIIQLASESDVDLHNEIKRLKSTSLFKSEIEDIEKVLMSNKKSDGVQGDATLWKLSQAMTAVARDSESARRQREIEEISGKLFDRLKLD